MLNFLTFQFTVSGHLGADGPLALSPVDVELEIEVGKRSKLLNMVVGDVLGKVRQAKLALKEEIVQVKKPVFDTIFS